jgi:hypothetical protein
VNCHLVDISIGHLVYALLYDIHDQFDIGEFAVNCCRPQVVGKIEVNALELKVKQSVVHIERKMYG